MSRLESELSALMRSDWGRLLSVLIRELRDFELAEDCLSEAFARALVHWDKGLPRNPQGWLLQVARRRAIDRIRRAQNFQSKRADLTHLIDLDARSSGQKHEIPDERLRLIFTACHPGLDQKSRVALTLRTLCGLTTGEIARAFLDKDTTMGQRLSRAKAKIAQAGIPYRVPAPEDWDERLQSVLAVIYLIFNEGYSASSGESQIRHELCDEAIFLARQLDYLRPDTPETMGLLALLLLGHARSPARLSPQGASVPLSDQDRGLWDGTLAQEGVRVIKSALGLGRIGPFQLQAAISAVHIEASSFEETNWTEITLLYNRLMEMSPSKVIELNRAVAISFAVSPQRGLEALPESMAGYQSYHAARADMLRRSGACDEASAAYDMALSLTSNTADRAFLSSRKRSLV